MQGNNRIGLCDTFRLGRLCGPELRNGTGFFLVPGFPVPDPARGISARERESLHWSRKKRAVTVDVLVLVLSR
jgi:hypothetical protein